MSLLSPNLQAFIAVCQYKTVHAAADALCLTQTAVTQRIHNLEHQLKTTLFIRSRRGMLLTHEGEALLRYCKAATDLEGETLAYIKQTAIETSVQLRISGPTSFMSSRIIPLCTAFLPQFPQLFMHLDMNDGEQDYLLDELRSGRSDFVILNPGQAGKEVKQKKLAPEHYVLVCCAAWKNRKLPSIIKQEYIIDYNPSDQLTFAYLKQFNLFDAANHHRHFVNRTDMLAHMIAQGLGYGVLTKEFSQPFIERGELIILNQGKTFENHLSLAWYDRPQPSPYFTKIITSLK